ncbi:hypothetical protein DRJ25_00545 [Candidatus Woesearchaeota archaeon]|nr:MAG: hypothetical protein DRJ25_00545 [Candidatus Woesearchaeota archaeon]
MTFIYLFCFFCCMDIKLSQKVFKALASPTRISILKELDRRRFTQSELSENLGFAIPTIKQHLQDLEKAGLVNCIENGRKWKYFELSKEGKAILHPEEKKIWILLGTFAVSVVGGIIAAAQRFISHSSADEGRLALAENYVATTAAQKGNVVFTGSPVAHASTANFPVLFFVFIALAVISFLGVLFFLARRKRMMRLLKSAGSLSGGKIK